uniref:Uncharacterized protein n=1 Tax=Vespula pensylvanica TaxID=30213 RepID=A0A834PDH9_VESPE|nr:hypothetical protein H0235_000113 [Vespula pensylvanica]
MSSSSQDRDEYLQRTNDPPFQNAIINYKIGRTKSSEIKTVVKERQETSRGKDRARSGQAGETVPNDSEASLESCFEVGGGKQHRATVLTGRTGFGRAYARPVVLEC